MSTPPPFSPRQRPAEPTRPLAAQDEEDAPVPQRSHKARNAILVAAGLVLTVLGFSLLRQSKAIPFPAPSGAGTQERVHEGTTFRNFDATTNIESANLRTPVILEIPGAKSMKAFDKFAIYEVTGGPRQWVFIWQGGGRENALQGIPSPLETSPTRVPQGRVASVVDRVTQHDAPPSAALASTNEDPPPPPASYKQQLSEPNWRHTLAFVFLRGEAPLYVAFVDHPTDAPSEARANAFVDDAITRKRTIHHGPALLALMMASTRPVPQAWLDWLASAANRNVDQLISESDPKQQEPANGLLRERAAETRIDAAVALAVLSDFQQTAPLLAAMKDLPQPVAQMLVEWCRLRPVKPSQSTGLSEVFALMPALELARFEIARFESDPRRLTALALDGAEDSKLPADARTEYGHAAAQRVFDHDPAGVPRLAAVIELLIDDPKAIHRDELAHTLRRIDRARMLNLLLKQSEREDLAYHPPKWAVAQWNLVLADAVKHEAYVREQLERVAKVLHSPDRPRSVSVVTEVSQILTAFKGVKPTTPGASPGTPAGKSAEAIEMEAMAKSDPNRAYMFLEGYCFNKDERHLAALRAVLEGGFNPDFAPDGKSPILNWAVGVGNVEAVKLLLKHGAAPNLKTEAHRSALDSAVRGKNVEMVRLLLKAGAKVRNTSQTAARVPAPTLVAAAAQQAPVEIVALLLDHGADLAATGIIRPSGVAIPNGEVVPPGTALDLAMETGNKDVIDLLKQRGGKTLRAKAE